MYNLNLKQMITYLSIKPNHRNKTFTIRKDGTKYRTSRLLKHEFESMLHNTFSDWENYLRTSQDYYIIKK